MGKRGPPPTPTPILKLHGSWRGNLNRDEPQPEPGPPDKPPWLDDYASEAWDQFVPILADMCVLTRADGAMLALLCTTWARWRRCEEFVAERGEVYTIKDADGKARELRRFPQAVASESLGRAMNRYLGEFGLSPSARARIHVTPRRPQPGEDDGFGSRFFTRA
jgi:P27 family predicted phage terminase small subunit